MEIVPLFRDWGYTFLQTIVISCILEQHWETILNYFEHDEKWTVIAGTCWSLVVPYFLVNIFLISLDLFGKPEILMKYKIQKDKNVPCDTRRYLKCILVGCLNKMMTCAAVFLFYPIMKYRGMSNLYPLPSMSRFVFEYIIMIIVNEIIFYYCHRLVHQPFLYKYVHKMHHEWIIPVGFASIYNNPIDHVLLHILPLLGPSMVAGSHMMTLWVWCILYQFESALQHSNFHFPFVASPQFHNYHHLKFNENYGAVGWLDSLHGTNKNYLKSIQAKRSMLYFDLTPVCQKYPSSNPKEN